MTDDCPDCGGRTRLGRPTRQTTGLPVRLRVHRNSDVVNGQRKLNVTATVCDDCGRVRFHAAVDDPRKPARGDEEAGEDDAPDPEEVGVDPTACPVCEGETALVSPTAGGFDIRLVENTRGRGPRARLALVGLACGDCGAVAFYTDVSGDDVDEEATCPSCDSGMRLTTTGGGGGMRIIVDDGADGGRDRVDPIAWACRDCGLSLFYDPDGGEDG